MKYILSILLILLPLLCFSKTKNTIDVYSAPSTISSTPTETNLNTLTVFYSTNNWLKVGSSVDGHVGWIKESDYNNKVFNRLGLYQTTISQQSNDENGTQKYTYIKYVGNQLVNRDQLEQQYTEIQKERVNMQINLEQWWNKKDQLLQQAINELNQDPMYNGMTILPPVIIATNLPSNTDT